jgi:phage baseplate assembly protein W
MAKTAPQIQRFSDFALSFQSHPVTGDIVMVTGVQAVVQAVVNLVQINHFEVPFHPEIGGNVRKLLFENIDPITANLLSEEVKNVITNFEPRAQIINVLVEANLDNNGYNVTLQFYVVNNVSPITVSVFLERLR